MLIQWLVSRSTRNEAELITDNSISRFFFFFIFKSKRVRVLNSPLPILCKTTIKAFLAKGILLFRFSNFEKVEFCTTTHRKIAYSTC